MKEHMRVVYAVALAALLSAGLAYAGDDGKFTMLLTASHDYAVVEHAEGTVFGGGLEGVATIVTSTGLPFAKDSHFYVACVAYGKRGPADFRLETSCTATDAKNKADRFYTSGGRKVGTARQGGGGDGEVQIVGGTGRFAGVEANCPYDAAYLAENRNVTSLACEWSRSGKRE